MLARDGFERGFQALIGGDPAGDHQHALRPLPGVPLVKREAARRPVGDDVGDRLLEARAEIGDVLLAQRRARQRLVPERGLEAGQREMRLARGQASAAAA